MLSNQRDGVTIQPEVKEILKEETDFSFSQPNRLETEEIKLFDISRIYKRVLVIEDDITQSPFIEDMLLEINPEVDIEWEVDGKIAINRIMKAQFGSDQSAFDLIISDIELEGELSGVDVFNFSLQITPQTKFLLVSGHGLNKLQKDYFKNLAPLEYLQKPINITKFLKTVSAAIS
ncbi:MAG: hypothetical protein CME65_01845 [Halobacteriovoraceae bacterium]|nr:hypothetical protein [Halobacteriovoraceae bacterium]|tara:strand:- start:6895 stop:7422 length:528 start_codon:yes stop_codon:yes gene_type:complete